MAFCSQCGADVTGVTFCAKCGAPAEGGAAAPGGQPGAASPPPNAGAQAAPSAGADSQDNVMGALAYLTPVPAIIFLLIEPYKDNHFIRFHSFQMLFYCGAVIVVSIAMAILSLVMAFVGIGFILAILGFLLNFGYLAIWALLAFKAYQGEKFKLPIIGDLAEKQV